MKGLAATVLLVLVAALAPPAAAQALLRDGFEDSCHVDTDGDRLVDCEEAARLTSRTDPDTDDDGLGDGDEVLGTAGGLDLPGLGVNPRRRDLLLEYDWQDDNVEPFLCAFHSHRPDQQTLEELRVAFLAAPVANPDGSTGIHLIQNAGQGGMLTGGNAVDIAGATIQGQVAEAHFASHRDANFAPNRVGYFHYVLNTHAYTAFPGSSGQAEIVGDDMLVTLGCRVNQDYIRNTIMHELGHNLGLRHGGDTHCNHKPNYNSVMNYRYQFDGIDTNCLPGGDGVMDYSIGVRAPLDEAHLDETAGMCGGIAIDWNLLDGGLFTDIAHDINRYSGQNPVENQTQHCGGLITVLSDWNDWAAITMKGLPGAPGGGQQVPPELSTCD